MPASPDPDATAARRRIVRPLLLALAHAAGFALTLRVFYPGIMTYDARYVYEDMQRGFYGDWQSPVMGLVWRLTEPLAPGSAGIFLLNAGLYWAGFAVLSLVLARRAFGVALAVPALALAPPAFVLLGVIWRDVLLAGSWLLAAALALAAADGPRRRRIIVQGVALALVGFGLLLRPNALLAAPVLAAYVLWPQRFSLRRAALVYLPGVLAGFLLVQAVYYGALGATRQHAIQSIMVFDLGGITHFTQRNQFPLDWTPREAALLHADCYDPSEWNAYWLNDPCRFVMERLEAEGLFGSPALAAAWRRALLAHPLAYLKHRAAHVWQFLAGENFTLWTHDLDDPSRTVFADDPAFAALRTVHDALKPTPVFRAGSWALLCLLVGFAALRARSSATGAFAVGVSAAGAVYTASYALVGVASDFRYAYFTVLAALAGAAAACAQATATAPAPRPG